MPLKVKISLFKPITAILSLCAFLSTAAAQPAPSAGRPRLVVGIVIDQLRTDCLEQLRPLMCADGFRQFMTRGTYMRDLNFQPARLDIASATAMLFTGATPDKTGVPSAYTYSETTMRREPTMSDPSAMGNFTSATYSPRSLRLSTITDEVMIDGAGLGMTHAIATDPQQALAMAGHAASGALWLDTNTGKWSTSTYYGDMPQPASNRNYRHALSARLDTMQWKPMLPLDSYPGLPAQKRYYPFRHTFPSSGRDVYRQFAASPKANTEVTDLAIDYINTLRMGSRGDAIDMLCVGLTAAPFKYVKDGDYRLELADTYLRLDRDIERLLHAVDKAVGLGNALIFITSTGYYDDATHTDAKYKIPGGEFSAKRALSLLNTYLSGRYGQGDYVSAYADSRFYLNTGLIEGKKLEREQVAVTAKNFLSKMSGVDRVYTLADILSSTSADEEAWRLCTDPRSAADLTVEITPGWTLADDTAYPPVSVPVRRARYHAPAMILGTGVPATTVSTPVDAASLAPTITGLLRLRAPNGASAAPLLLP